MITRRQALLATLGCTGIGVAHVGASGQEQMREREIVDYAANDKADIFGPIWRRIVYIDSKPSMTMFSAILQVDYSLRAKSYDIRFGDEIIGHNRYPYFLRRCDYTMHRPFSITLPCVEQIIPQHAWIIYQVDALGATTDIITADRIRKIREY